MLKRRIIPCLDIKDGRTVKGVNFLNIRDAGDPVELAVRYVNAGADELVFLDISATHEKRATLVETVNHVAEVLSIPFTVGGGVRCVEDARALLDSGADKVAVNSSAVANPKLVSELAYEFGSQCIVVAIDCKIIDGQWRVVTAGGRHPTDSYLYDWVLEVEQSGAGEILLTSMEHDGTKSGFAIELLKEVYTRISIPLIASGGAGKIEHFKEVLSDGVADAALAASVFHFGEIHIPDLKRYLSTENIPVRNEIY